MIFDNRVSDGCRHARWPLLTFGILSHHQTAQLKAEIYIRCSLHLCFIRSRDDADDKVLVRIIVRDPKSSDHIRAKT